MRRLVLRRPLRRVGPSRNRVGQTAELPEHFAQMKAGVDVFRRFANRTAEAQHRVDDSAAMLMLAASGEPLRGFLQRHVLRRAFSAFKTGCGVTRYSVRPTSV